MLLFCLLDILFISLLRATCFFVEVNPGPNEALSISYQNFNSISAHNIVKLHFLKAYMTSQRFDIIYFAGPYPVLHLLTQYVTVIHLTASMKLSVFITKRCFVFKSLRVCDIRPFDDFINFELRVGSKFCRLFTLYMSPSQKQYELLSVSQTLN